MDVCVESLLLSIEVVFVYLIAASGRDFGPMLEAEQNAATSVPGYEGPTFETPEAPARAINALLPLGVLILGTLAGIYWTEDNAVEKDIIENRFWQPRRWRYE